MNNKLSLYEWVELFILAGVVSLAATLLIDTWRKSWMRPVAGFLLAILFGYGVDRASMETHWIITCVLVGAVAGPNIVIFLQGKKFTDALQEMILDRVKKR